MQFTQFHLISPFFSSKYCENHLIGITISELRRKFVARTLYETCLWFDWMNILQINSNNRGFSTILFIEITLEFILNGPKRTICVLNCFEFICCEMNKFTSLLFSIKYANVNTMESTSHLTWSSVPNQNSWLLYLSTGAHWMSTLNVQLCWIQMDFVLGVFGRFVMAIFLRFIHVSQIQIH